MASGMDREVIFFGSVERTAMSCSPQKAFMTQLIGIAQRYGEKRHARGRESGLYAGRARAGARNVQEHERAHPVGVRERASGDGSLPAAKLRTGLKTTAPSRRVAPLLNEGHVLPGELRRLHEALALPAGRGAVRQKILDSGEIHSP